VGGGWTVQEIPDLATTVAIVTGASGGIGSVIARELARKSASVVLACRSADRGHVTAESIRIEIPDARVDVMTLDLGRLRSIRRFAEAFRHHHDRVDLLINNAGVLLVPHGTTEDGFERHFGINHLGHFALTGLLFDRLLASERARVVTVSSRGHVFGRIDVESLTDGASGSYSAARAYAGSKLANLMFTYELQRRLRTTNLIAVAAHPGGAATDLGRRLGDRRSYRAIRPVLEWLSQSAAQAALPILRAATDPGAAGGEFYGPSGRLGMRGRPVKTTSSPRSRDEEAARRLWQLSEKLTGIHFA
jgi:NAD(P)-dependent dehydrogenase (short-subunit alcohol dehydrogenase family)